MPKRNKKWITKYTAVRKCASLHPNYEDSKLSSVFHVLRDKIVLTIVNI